MLTFTDVVGFLKSYNWKLTIIKTIYCFYGNELLNGSHISTHYTFLSFKVVKLITNCITVSSSDFITAVVVVFYWWCLSTTSTRTTTTLKQAVRRWNKIREWEKRKSRKRNKESDFGRHRRCLRRVQKRTLNKMRDTKWEMSNAHALEAASLVFVEACRSVSGFFIEVEVSKSYKKLVNSNLSYFIIYSS